MAATYLPDSFSELNGDDNKSGFQAVFQIRNGRGSSISSVRFFVCLPNWSSLLQITTHISRGLVGRSISMLLEPPFAILKSNRLQPSLDGSLFPATAQALCLGQSGLNGSKRQQQSAGRLKISDNIIKKTRRGTSIDQAMIVRQAQRHHQTNLDLVAHNHWQFS